MSKINFYAGSRLLILSFAFYSSMICADLQAPRFEDYKVDNFFEENGRDLSGSNVGGGGARVAFT